uniref:Uncharacterized protein n=1 Tax=Anguilla anguilla TaxID=7936 RepID=A0A0E9XKX3_ANGAN
MFFTSTKLIFVLFQRLASKQTATLN